MDGSQDSKSEMDDFDPMDELKLLLAYAHLQSVRPRKPQPCLQRSSTTLHCTLALRASRVPHAKDVLRCACVCVHGRCASLPASTTSTG